MSLKACDYHEESDRGQHFKSRDVHVWDGEGMSGDSAQTDGTRDIYFRNLCMFVEIKITTEGMLYLVVGVEGVSTKKVWMTV